MRRYASGTKSHIAINAFSNAATVQRLSPARCKRSRRRAPRSSFPLSPSQVFHALGLGRTCQVFQVVRTSARALRLGSSCRFSINEKRTWVSRNLKRFDFTYWAGCRTDRVSVGLERISKNFVRMICEDFWESLSDWCAIILFEY